MMNGTLNIEHIVRCFDNLNTTQGQAFTIPIRWAKGGGTLMVTREEWEKQSPEGKTALVKARLETLWRQVNETPHHL